MKQLLVVALVSVIAFAVVALSTAPTYAGKPCGPNGCPKGQFCILGECHKTIPCEIVLCVPCPEGFVLSPTKTDCCRCVPGGGGGK